MTVDAVNEALAGRNESDVPLKDPYWGILNAYRMELSKDSTRPDESPKEVEIEKPPVPEIFPNVLNQLDLIFVPKPVDELVVEPVIIAQPVESNDKELDDFLSSL